MQASIEIPKVTLNYKPLIMEILLDSSFILSVLSVFLTVLFFVIGYRQTIGARRERAGIANQSLVDTFFRRLALEDNFDISRADVEKVLSGWALNAKLRRSDIYSLQDLENLLSAKAIESDYVAETQRREIGERLSKIFNDNKNSVFIGAPKKDNKKIRPELVLGVVSGFASLLAAAGTTMIGSTLTGTGFIRADRNSIEVMAVAILSTVLIMLTYLWVKDSFRPSVNETSSAVNTALELERVFLGMAKNHGIPIKISDDRSFDFIIEHRGDNIGVEIKMDINSVSKKMLEQIISRISSSISSGRIQKGVIISGERPRKSVSELCNDKISIEYINDFIYRMKN